MSAEHPPELKGFHNRNMLHMFIIFAIPASAGAWALYRQEASATDDELQSILGWVFMIGVGLFMLTILFKALISIPKCPKCGKKMKQLKTISITQKPNNLKKTSMFNPESTTRWRIVDCASCNLRYRIHGLSVE